VSLREIDYTPVGWVVLRKPYFFISADFGHSGSEDFALNIPELHPYLALCRPDPVGW